MKLCLGFFLTLHAVTDVRGGYIYLPFVWVQMAVGVVAVFLSGADAGVLPGRLLPGLCVYFISMVSREKIGRGDAWLIMAAGLYLDLWQQLELMFTASVLAFLWTTLRMVTGHVDKDTEIALAPFVWLGYLGGSCFGWF